MTSGTHDYLEDPRNATILISINGEMLLRDDAKVSVFDSGFMLGDGVWEGIRLHRGSLLFLDAHMDRLFEGAKAIDMDIGLSRSEMVARIRAALDANGMTTDVHIRLMVTRGIKSTPYQHPKVTITPPTVVIIPEYKVATEGAGLRLATVHVRRGAPDVQDPGLNSHSKLNCILAC
ncbi:MAG: aminotransferase class IV, partial [Rhodospirillaceae bacterium]|nr:aminotransferase class IV [Rhodospirillaceae bacterium]